MADPGILVYIAAGYRDQVFATGSPALATKTQLSKLKPPPAWNSLFSSPECCNKKQEESADIKRNFQKKFRIPLLITLEIQDLYLQRQVLYNQRQDLYHQKQALYLPAGPGTASFPDRNAAGLLIL
jgi:hypothetical protein